MIKYVDNFGRVIAESNSPIKFNLDLFPTFANLKEVKENKKVGKKTEILDSENGPREE